VEEFSSLLSTFISDICENWIRDEICPPLGYYYAASSGNFLLDVSGQPVGPNFKVQTGCHETFAKNYHYSLRNNPEELSPHLLSRGSLKSRMDKRYPSNDAEDSKFREY
jgi:hypothetical protein